MHNRPDTSPRASVARSHLQMMLAAKRRKQPTDHIPQLSTAEYARIPAHVVMGYTGR